MSDQRVSEIAAALQSVQGDAFVTLRTRLDRGGSLQARRLGNGTVQLYWRYSHAGRKHREPLGPYDASAPPKKLEPTPRGYSIAAALEKCRELAVIHSERADAGGLRGLKVERRQMRKVQQELAAELSQRSLRKLLETYVDHLKAQHRRSHVDAGQIFKRHVFEPWPKLADAPAVELTADQVLDMLRRLIEVGKGRTANKLRSYLRAAFQCALDVRFVASIPMAFKTFSVTMNPVALTRRSPQYDRADKRPLTKSELCTYWQLLTQTPGARAAALRLHLLTGGQRIEQFVRLLSADASQDALQIYDLKGRPGQGARPHRVPLVHLARHALADIGSQGQFAISTTGGVKPISVRTLAGWAHEIVGDTIAAFTLKRIRSGVETLLAARGVTREVRGHLQSHGMSGVQARHYDGHDYMAEKRRALEILTREVCQPATAPQKRTTFLRSARSRSASRRRPLSTEGAPSADVRLNADRSR
ncbi:MAG: integrase [Burkholderiaceae bacterium]|nr:integrase [Burkholderiaceae bacterium]